MLDDLEQQIFAVNNQSVKLEVRPTRQLVMETIFEIEQLYESRAGTREPAEKVVSMSSDSAVTLER